MSIDWKTGRWKYSSDLIYMGDKKIKEIWRWCLEEIQG